MAATPAPDRADPQGAPMTPVILSIDCGTQSMRTLLFSGEGTLLDSEQVE